MLEGVGLDVEEVAVVGIAGNLYPIVITTKRIIWRPGNNPLDLRFAEIVKIDAPHARISKLDTSELQITTSAGEVHQVQTEPGKTFFILWNLMLNLMPRSATPLR